MTEAHRMGLKVMVDVVANHMGNGKDGFNSNFPFNQSDHYHDYCSIN